MGVPNILIKASLPAAALLAMVGVATAEEDTIKVGILHSLSGTMAISETTLKDVMLMLIEKQNEAGGVLGKQLEAVVVDPASDWPLFAEKARELIAKSGIELDLNGIPYDDDKSYGILGDGHTIGVFQLESSGMKDLVRKAQPNNIEDIIALVALYRPGPMENIPKYLAAKHGREDQCASDRPGHG